MKLLSRPLILSLSMPPEAVTSFARCYQDRVGDPADLVFHRFEAPSAWINSAESLDQSWLAGRFLVMSIPRLVCLELCAAASPLGWFAPHEGAKTGVYRLLELGTYNLDEALEIGRAAEIEAASLLDRMKALVARSKTRTPSP
jgi:hypothetical protein